MNIEQSRESLQKAIDTAYKADSTLGLTLATIIASIMEVTIDVKEIKEILLKGTNIE